MQTQDLAVLEPALCQVPVTIPAAVSMPHGARFYRPELDVLRCLAFFLVFTSHVLPFPYSAAASSWLSAVQEGVSGGVPLFFILTSFLITELLMREHESTGTIHIGSFYARRILRIWPLYFLAIFIAVLLPHLMPHFERIDLYAVPFLLMGGNWVIVHHGWFHNPMLTPLWSTAIQEQFYLVWPLLVSWWGYRGMVWMAGTLLPLAWLTDYGLPAMHHTRSPELWCNSINQFQFFALGALLAIALHHRPLRLARGTRVLLLLAGAGAFFFSGAPCHFINQFVPSTPAYTLAGYLALDVGCVCLCLAFLGARVPRWAHPLMYLGKISFGLYIFHYAILSVVSAAIKKLHFNAAVQLFLIYITTALLAVLVASVSYHYFEKPFLRFKSRFTFVRSRPA